ncbi:hypothetical protein DAPPUDRAFT_107072 [Daphnia pulex]|uniref:Uncharacterized protein n=1 Tax=Daphnia pulex TaxID=6669 RepID=E9GVV3_DAPPU|nr:hypothetical protein DAPPUDRAFT_107072 [Daphnia pulex]|eukprot:EFX76245.1 hypothetical protein DAPPUDRAFT_107072 [Daphnia pulex]
MGDFFSKNNTTDLLETQVDGGGEEAVRSAVAVAGHDSADPGLVHRRQVQFGGHRAVGNNLIFLLVGEDVVHQIVDAAVAQQAGGADHHHVAVMAVITTDAVDGTAAAQHAVHVVVVVGVELVAGREEQRRRTLEHVVVGRHSR